MLGTRPHGAASAAAALALLVACAALASTSGCATTPPRPDAPRIVVLAPAAGEMLDALGLADRVVGVGAHGPWPASIAERPSVGNFDAPSSERILELSASHVVTTRSVAAAPHLASLRRLGLEIVEVDTETLDGVFTGLRALGEAFERDAAAARLAADLRGELDAVRRRTADLPQVDVLIVVGREPLFVAGPGSHLDALVEIAGGRNVFGDAGRAYRQVSMEAVLERAPQAIVDLAGDGGAAWSAWPFLPAVRDGRVHVVDPETLSVPGVRVGAMARALAALLHPEAFAGAEDDAA